MPCMIVDALTKKMKPHVQLKTIQSGNLALQPTVESDALKMRKRTQRVKKRGEESQGVKLEEC